MSSQESLCEICDTNILDFSVSREDDRPFQQLVQESRESVVKHVYEENHIQDRRGVFKWIINASLSVADEEKEILLNELDALNDEKSIKLLEKRGVIFKSEWECKNTVLHSAVKNCVKEVVEWLLYNGCDMNTVDSNYVNSLQIASKNGHLKLLMRLDNIAAELKSGGFDLHSIANAAVENGHIHIMQWLVKNKKYSLHSDSSLVNVSITFSQFEMLEWLINNGADLTKKSYLPCVHEAVRSGKIEVLKWLVKKGANLFEKCNQRLTVFHIAAEFGFVNIAKYLIREGAEINERKIYGYTPLHLAAENRNLAMVVLLVHNGSLINTKDRNGTTVMHLAVCSENLEIVKFLHTHGGDIITLDDCNNTLLHKAGDRLDIVQYLCSNGLDYKQKNNDGHTALYVASRHNCISVVQFLLESSGDINDVHSSAAHWMRIAASNKTWDLLYILIHKNVDVNKVFDGQTLLHIAASTTNKMNVFKLLIENMANLNIQNSEGKTVLHLLAIDRKFDLMKRILSLGGDISIKDNDKCTVLHYAVTSHKTVKFLIEKGSEIDSQDKNGTTVLAKAAMYRNFKTVKYLVDHGASLNIADNNNESILYKCSIYYSINLPMLKYLIPLSQNINLKSKFGASVLHNVANTCDNKKLGIFKLLIKHGADVNAIDDCHSTVLHAACRNLHYVHVLLNSNCAVNVKNNLGQTPLHIASSYGSLQVLKLLVTAKSDINAIDNKNNSALHLSAMSRDSNCVQYLVDHGADLNIRNDDGKSVLHFLSDSSENSDLIRRIVLKGAELNTQDKKGNTLLLLLDYYGDLAVWLIEHGADINIRNDEGYSVLDRAILAFNIMPCVSKVHIITCLMQRELGRSVLQKDRTMLLNSIKYFRYLNALQYIINKIDDMNAKNVKGYNALHHAVSSANSDGFKMLVKHNANLNVTNNKGNSILHIAASKNQLMLLKLIMPYINEEMLMLRNKYLDTALHHAVWAQNLEIVKILVQRGIDVNCRNKNLQSALHIASQKGDVTIVRYLISNGANLTDTSQSNMTPLLYAAKHGKKELVKLLIEECEPLNKVNKEGGEHVKHTDLSPKNLPITKARTDRGETVLHLAARYGKYNNQTTKIVSYLVENNTVPINDVDNNGNTALHAACCTFMVDTITCLVENGANVNAKNNDGSTALHFAAATGSIDIVNFLLEKGCEINLKNRRGNTPLHISTSRARYRAIKCFIERGADLIATNKKGLTAYHMVAVSGGLHLFEHLHKHKPLVISEMNPQKNPLPYVLKCDNNHKVINTLVEIHDVNEQDIFGNTVLHVACRFSKLHVVESILSKNGLVNAVNLKGETALYVAVKHAKIDLIVPLLDKGYDLNITDSCGNNVLHLACMKNCLNIVTLLIEKGVDINAINGVYNTALHIAVENNYLYIAQVLIESKANVNIVNCFGHTVLHIAASKGNLELAAMIVESDIDVNTQCNKGMTALHYAAKYGHVDIVTHLIACAGANVELLNLNGQTAEKIAIEYKNNHVSDILASICQ